MLHLGSYMKENIMYRFDQTSWGNYIKREALSSILSLIRYKRRLTRDHWLLKEYAKNLRLPDNHKIKNKLAQLIRMGSPPDINSLHVTWWNVHNIILHTHHKHICRSVSLKSGLGTPYKVCPSIYDLKIQNIRISTKSSVNLLLFSCPLV